MITYDPHTVAANTKGQAGGHVATKNQIGEHPIDAENQAEGSLANADNPELPGSTENQAKALPWIYPNGRGDIQANGVQLPSIRSLDLLNA